MKHIIFLYCSLIFLLSSCNTADTAYHHYEQISDEGWQNCDTLTFTVDTIRRYGDYTSYICLRTHPDFPYRFLSLIVEQTNMPKGTKKKRSVRVEIVNKDGAQEGTGITLHTYEVPLFKQWLGPGDSVRIAVKHNMTREQMPGIMNVGVKLERE